MPKKKNKNSAAEPGETFKEAGNKAFLAQNFDEAITQYTKAIEMSTENPNHIYFANRANVLLEQAKYEECIADCDEAIKIEEKYIKSHYRKCKALFS